MANGEGPSRVEKLNQITRSVITLALTAATLYGFVVAKTISAEVFVPLASGIITWWFVRDQATAATKDAVALINAPPPTAAPAPEAKNP